MTAATQHSTRLINAKANLATVLRDYHERIESAYDGTMVANGVAAGVRGLAPQTAATVGNFASAIKIAGDQVAALDHSMRLIGSTTELEAFKRRVLAWGETLGGVYCGVETVGIPELTRQVSEIQTVQRLVAGRFTRQPGDTRY